MDLGCGVGMPGWAALGNASEVNIDDGTVKEKEEEGDEEEEGGGGGGGEGER